MLGYSSCLNLACHLLAIVVVSREKRVIDAPGALLQ